MVLPFLASNTCTPWVVRVVLIGTSSLLKTSTLRMLLTATKSSGSVRKQMAVKGEAVLKALTSFLRLVLVS